MNLLDKFVGLNDKIQEIAQGDDHLGPILNDEYTTHADDYYDYRITSQTFLEQVWQPLAKYRAEIPVFQTGTNFCDEESDNILCIHYKDTQSNTNVNWKGKLTNLPASIAGLLWKHGRISGFGNSKTNQTEFDPKVRNARELLIGQDFSLVDSKIVKRVEELWSRSNLYPKDVCAVPYKINIYGKGGFFVQHLDTPSSHLIGTFIIGLCNTTRVESFVSSAPALVIGNHSLYQHRWEGHPNHYVAFYTDVPHQVTLIPQGFRVTLTFKIYHKEKSDENPIQQEFSKEKHSIFNQVIENLSQWPRPFGFLLSHMYTLHNQVEELKGVDKLLYQVLHQMILRKNDQKSQDKILYVPVVIRHVGVNVYRSNPSYEGDVYLLSLNSIVELIRPGGKVTEQEILDSQFQEKNKEILRNIKDEIPFFQWNKGDQDTFGSEWKKIEDPEGYTGNESNGGRIDATYLCCALIVV